MSDTSKIIPVHSARARAVSAWRAPAMPGVHGGAIVDRMQRPLRDLRISVTDRCNLRCTYCMPREVFGERYAFLPRAELLSFEEIERLARPFIRLGVKKIRLTGGEPLLRRGIEKLVGKLASLRDPEGVPVEVALTTNGLLLSQKARSLKDAGLARLTVSLDGLSEATYRRMSDSEVPVATVLEGIEAAQRAGFDFIKVNMVVRRGANDHEIVPMAGHFRNSGIVLRFIEYMDVGSTNGWRMDDVVPAREMLERVADRYPVHPVGPNYHGEVAERWRYLDGGGEIGLIASVTQAFCDGCTRARLSTDGRLYTCLFAVDGLDLREPLRHGAADRALDDMVAGCWERRADRYSQLRHTATAAQGKKIEMSYIGG
ncbi:MAG: GTP 3',8-cyclase MoaA [Nitrosomonadales bacterium]|nr:GTP 3',8-cyclase MoaA [Nitrosomonadales bacterium]